MKYRLLHPSIIKQLDVSTLKQENEQLQRFIIEKASEFLSLGATVCAICGASAALANFGLLDKRPHTSNGAGFLEMVSYRV